GTQNVYRSQIEDADIERERRRFRAAVRLSRRQLETIKERAEKELGRGNAYIFDAHLLFLEDAKLTRDVEDYIVREHANAEWAAKVVGDRLLSIYRQINDDYLRERGSDIEDVIQRLLANLTGEVSLHPEPGTIEQYEFKAEGPLVSFHAEPVRERGPVTTTDGVTVALRANVELASEFNSVERFGACGVGLFRSEFLLLRPG